jgi:hypothetical protein
MVVNTLNPAAYVQRVKIPAESNQQQITLSLLEQAALERSPNYRHKDGRIYASSPSEPYFAVSVSPLNPEFENQIESGILPVVKALLEKNYLPISSCEGHHDLGQGDTRTFVRIVFGSDESADEFINEFGTMEYVTLEKLQTSANIVQWWENGQPHWRAKYNDEITNSNLEHQDINFMFKRNYKQVCYVDLNLHDGRHYPFWAFIKRWKMHRDIKANKHTRIQNIKDRILSMKVYEL